MCDADVGFMSAPQSLWPMSVLIIVGCVRWERCGLDTDAYHHPRANAQDG